MGLQSKWAVLAVGLALTSPAAADDCLNPDALGMTRTLAVDPAVFARVGTTQYPTTLPLRPKEVILTFDDGPIPGMTPSVLHALRNECVQATFFLVGRYAKAHPEIARQIAEERHTIANHTESHHLVTLPGPHGIKEFDAGFASIAAVLAPDYAPAPFFRFPGLFNTPAVESHAKARGVTVMSGDVLADDWTGIGPEQIIARALARLQIKGSGILLLHDVQPALALALPKLLRELKRREYRVVHIVPAAGAGAPPPLPDEPAVAAKPAPAPVAVRHVSARPAAKPAEPEPAEFLPFARWRKMLEQRKGERAAATYPAFDHGGQ